MEKGSVFKGIVFKKEVGFNSFRADDKEEGTLELHIIPIRCVGDIFKVTNTAGSIEIIFDLSA